MTEMRRRSREGIVFNVLPRAGILRSGGSRLNKRLRLRVRHLNYGISKQQRQRQSKRKKINSGGEGDVGRENISAVCCLLLWRNVAELSKHQGGQQRRSIYRIAFIAKLPSPTEGRKVRRSYRPTVLD